MLSKQMKGRAARASLSGLALWLCISAIPVPPARGAASGVTVRVPAGFEMAVPAGWSWQSLSEDKVNIRFPRPAGKSPNYIEVSFHHEPARIPANPNLVNLRERRTLPNGTEVLWKIEAGPSGWSLSALLPRGTDGGRIQVFSNYFSQAERPNVERAFLAAVGSIRLLPVTRTIAYPDKRFAVDLPQGGVWRAWVEAGQERISLIGHLSELVEPQARYRDVWFANIYVYPAPASLTTNEAALADIRDHFARSGIVYGPVQREDFPGGSALWVESAGAARPLVGAALVDGKIFFVNCERTTPAPSPGRELPGEAEIREGFQSALRTVRPAP